MISNIFLQELCLIISKLFNVVITTIDVNYIRTAGTERYEKEIGKKVTNSNVFRSVIENNETIIITNPGSSLACASCENRFNCTEKAAIYAPLHIKGEVCGAIGIIAFTDEQKNSGLFRQDVFISFTEKLSDLISSKIEACAYEKELRINLKETVAVLNSIHDGVIAIDNNLKVYRISNSAIEKFKIDKNIINGTVSDILPKDIVEGIRKNIEYIDTDVIIKNKTGQLHVLLTVKNVIDEGEKKGNIIIMKSMKEVNAFATKILHDNAYTVDFGDIIGDSREMREVKNFANKISDSDSTVLIRGESGTGKELFARAIHNASARRNAPFVAINCGAIPESLLESELFGYEEGAFTGARKNGKIGKCELAHNGTLFLDEIGDVPLSMQVKFLRMLQEKTIERVGGSKSININVRVIAATNRKLESMIETNEFRSDLYYRLSVIPIFIPPLREHCEDIKLLADYFIKKYDKKLNKDISMIDFESLRYLENYKWPGNIRELENVIECAMNIESKNVLTIDSFPKRIKQNIIYENTSSSIREIKTVEAHRNKYDRDLIIETINKCGWDTEGKKKAAKELGIGIATLYRIIKKYQI